MKLLEHLTTTLFMCQIYVAEGKSGDNLLTSSLFHSLGPG